LIKCLEGYKEDYVFVMYLQIQWKNLLLALDTIEVIVVIVRASISGGPFGNSFA